MRKNLTILMIHAALAATSAVAATLPTAEATLALPTGRPAKPSNADALEQPPTARAAAPNAPFALTASDGSGLVLKRVEARVVLDGPLAWTELWLTFHNPEPRVREGRFAVTLPPDAALGRFAMRIGDAWMEGEVVEKHKAEVVYDDFLHARQDPAILTKDAGNQFSARVFPIAASADKQLVLAWSQPLADPSAPFVLPLAGLPRMAELGLHAWALRAGTPQVLVDVERKEVQPLQDLQLWPQSGAAEDAAALQDGVHALVRVRVESPQASAPLTNLTVLFDTSASAAPDFAQRLDRLQAVLALATQTVHVVAFDQVQLPVYDGAPAGFGAAQRAALQKRGALGASDLAAALGYLRQHKLPGETRVVLLSDCLATAGPTDAGRLRDAVRGLADTGVARLDVVLPDGARDQPGAAVMVAALPQPGTVVRGEAETLARLTRAVLPPVDVRVTDAVWSWPTQVTGLQPGDAFLVAAQLNPGQPLRLQLSGGASGELRPAVRPGNPALVQRAAAAAQIARLEAQLADADAATAGPLKQALVALSVGARLLSSQSAFLVLETEADYARYQIDRANPAPLLAIGGHGGLQAVKRGDPALALRALGDAQPEVQPEVRYRQGPGDGGARGALAAKASGRSVAADMQRFAENSEGVAMQQLVGSGGSDGGPGIALRQGLGRGDLRPPAPPPAKPAERVARVALGRLDGDGDAEVLGDVAKAVTARAPALKACYEQALRDTPQLAGKVTVQFTVGANGAVTGVAVSGADGPFASCITNKFAAIHGLPAQAEPRTYSQMFVFQRLEPPQPDFPPAETARQRRAAAAQQRAEQRDEARERREEAAQAQLARDGALADLKPLYARRVALGRCLTEGGGSTQRAAITVEIAKTGALTLAQLLGVSDAARPSVLAALRGAKAPVHYAGDRVALGLVRDGETWRFFPTPQAIAEASRHWQSPLATLADNGNCLLGPTHAERALQQQTAFDGELASLPDPSALRYADLADQLAGGKAQQVRDAAWQWHLQQPGEILPLVAYGRTLIQTDPQQAARAFGALIDLHPARADIRRFAANLLEATGAPGQALAADSYAAAQQLRPDHISGYPQRALALARAHQYAAALDLLAASLTAQKRADAARMSAELARDAFGLVAAAWLAAEPANAEAIDKRLAAVGAKLPSGPALRFLLTWETDGNDVDFHVGDAAGATACYSAPALASGGRLFEDVTTGYGPEWFAIDAPKAFPYTIHAHYYARGPMGFGMGRVLVVRWDGARLTFDDRPFVVTLDDESVALGAVAR